MPIIPLPRKAKFYKNADGFSPAKGFLLKLRNPATFIKIDQKIQRAELGNFGREGQGYRHLKNDLWELKVHYGSGYRVYFYLPAPTKILILLIGTKKTQKSDIDKALKIVNECKTEW